MNLAQALKKKNRLAGEIVRQNQILMRENSRRDDNPSTVDREEIYKKILLLTTQLSNLKAKITVANIGIYPTIEQMSELKSHIAFLQQLSKKEGAEIDYIGNEKVTYNWNCFINQEKCDKMVSDLQSSIDSLQDKVDEYNAGTLIE